MRFRNRGVRNQRGQVQLSGYFPGPCGFLVSDQGLFLSVRDSTRQALVTVLRELARHNASLVSAILHYRQQVTVWIAKPGNSSTVRGVQHAAFLVREVLESLQCDVLEAQLFDSAVDIGNGEAHNGVFGCVSRRDRRQT